MDQWQDEWIKRQLARAPELSPEQVARLQRLLAAPTVSEMGKLDPNERCEASGLTNRECVGSICDCFPGEDDRFGLHPEYFRVGVPGMTQAEQAAREAATLQGPTYHQCTECGGDGCDACNGVGQWVT